MTQVEKPINRSPIRQFFGKEYYILRRKLAWTFDKNTYSKAQKESFPHNRVFYHKSMILRPLKDVEMYLQENKRTNLRLATAKLDKILIKPGEIFSIWRLVGRPTKRKGYLEGLVLNQGKIEKGTGGGLCQLGNLLYWVFAHSPLEITERYRHGFDVFPDVNRKVPFGAGATLSFNHIDLQIHNKTTNTFQICLWLDDEYLNGELLSDKLLNKTYKVEEKNHLIKQQNWGGYTRHNQIVKTEKDKDGKETISLLSENHALMMYCPFLEDPNK